MSDIEHIVQTVRADPTELERYVDECFAVFVTGTPEEQQRVAQLLRAVAEHTPTVVADQSRLLEKALQAEPPACTEAIHAVAVITETEPKAVSGLVSELLTALETVDDAISYGSGVRALATIGDETDTAVSEGDELLADLLRDSEGRANDLVATNMSVLVIENPRDYPVLLDAYVDALTQTDPEVKTFAVKTLAVVAREDIEAVPNLDTVQSRLQELREDYHLDTETVERALEMVQQSMEGASEE